MPATSILRILLFVAIAINSSAQQDLNELSIIPGKDFFYLSNWKLEGSVKTVKVKTYKPHNPSRFTAFDECRRTAAAGNKFSMGEEHFHFNRAGRLIKRVTFTSTGKENTIFSYNSFGKIASIEQLDKILLFRYDEEGRMVATESYSGARVAVLTTVEYKGDSTIWVTTQMETGVADSIIEITNKKGQLIYAAMKLPTHPLKENFYEYDEAGRLARNWNNLNMYSEFEYDENNRVVRTFMRPDKSFLTVTEYDDPSGIMKMMKSEMINGEYVQRNYECLCTAIDGHNNPVKREFIDCSSSHDGDTFGLKGFLEVTYDYFGR